MPTAAVFNHITSMRMVLAMWCNGTCYKYSLLLIMFIITEYRCSVAAFEQLFNETVWVLWSQLSSAKFDHLILMILWSRPQSSMMGDYTNVTISVWSIICALVNSHMMTAQANENAKFEASERGISNKQDLPGHTVIFLKVTSTVFTTQILFFKSGPKCSSVNNEVIVSMLYINIRILHKNAQLCTFHSQHAT